MGRRKRYSAEFKRQALRRAEGISGVEPQNSQVTKCLTRHPEIIFIPVRRVERTRSATANLQSILSRVRSGYVTGMLVARWTSKMPAIPMPSGRPS